MHRVTQADVPMPYARSLELATNPNPQKIAEVVRRVLNKPAKQ